MPPFFFKQNSSNDFSNRPLMETDPEEHRLNYERYRTLVMIDSSGGQLTCSLLSLRSGNKIINVSGILVKLIEKLISVHCTQGSC